jgi:hypothetical protein
VLILRFSQAIGAMGELYEGRSIENVLPYLEAGRLGSALFQKRWRRLGPLQFTYINREGPCAVPHIIAQFGCLEVELMWLSLLAKNKERPWVAAPAMCVASELPRLYFPSSFGNLR